MTEIQNKVSILQAVSAYEALVHISKLFTDSKKFPTILSYKISKIMNALNDDVETFITHKEKLIKKYGKEKEEDDKKIISYIHLSKKEEEALNNEFNELTTETVTLNVSPIPFSLFNSEDNNIIIDPQVFCVIDWLIEED